MTCKDCIHKKVCDNLIAHGLPWKDGKYPAEKWCDQFKPTADVIEVKHGEWKYEQLDEYKFYKVTCPYCNAYYMGNYDAYNDPDDFNYCPNCGAKMDGERSENGT